jgi:galactokinase
MMGGGFGGSTISLVDPGAVDSLGAALGERYRQAYGKDPRVRVCRSASGAQRYP